MLVMLSTHLDVDMNFYHEYTAYLKGKNYSINSIGKCIKELKTVLRAAESEGYMVGVWTAQRISDYNNISRENIKHHRIPKLIDNRHPSEEDRSKDIHSCEQRTKKHIRTL